MKMRLECVPEELIIAPEERGKPLVLVPKDKPYRQVDYIIALMEYLDMAVDFPAAVLHDGIHYPFDFYSYSHDCLVKVLWHVDRDTIKQVAMLSKILDLVVIVDVNAVSCGECPECEKNEYCGRVVETARHLGAYLYDDHAILEYCDVTHNWEEVART